MISLCWTGTSFGTCFYPFLRVEMENSLNLSRQILSTAVCKLLNQRFVLQQVWIVPWKSEFCLSPGLLTAACWKWCGSSILGGTEPDPLRSLTLRALVHLTQMISICIKKSQLGCRSWSPTASSVSATAIIYQLWGSNRDKISFRFLEECSHARNCWPM